MDLPMTKVVSVSDTEATMWLDGVVLEVFQGFTVWAAGWKRTMTSGGHICVFSLSSNDRAKSTATKQSIQGRKSPSRPR